METSTKVVFQHATMTYYLMKIKIGEKLRNIEWTGGRDLRKDGFEGAYYQTEDVDEIAALKSHPEFNREFFVMNKVDIEKKNSYGDRPSQKQPDTTPGLITAPDDVTTINEKCDFINEEFGVPKSDINTAAKIGAWLKANPGKVKFLN